jgi:hypothetical protein
MREIRLSGLEGGVALTRHPYPYNPGVFWPFDALTPRLDRSGWRANFECNIRV